MAPILFAQSWRAEVDQRIAADPEYASGLYQALSRLNDKTEPPSLLDNVISQPWGQLRRDWYDAAAQIEVGLHLQAGWCVCASVELGTKPGNDKDHVGNDTKLKGLRAPFEASFHGGAGDCDGWFEWKRPIELCHDMGEGHSLTLRYPSSGVPLEVGRTEPETTIWHLRYEGGVARWPYEATGITLLLSTCSITGRGVPLRLPDVLAGAMRLAPPKPRPGPSGLCGASGPPEATT